ncbi:hypothetical protein ACFXAF_34915 [Kitasatospora sp. NPDC059463]|uniref:hypothetical protein n=1 Tax=unclassified Kitasatospora TaxID=2633591 RepID=UPI0036C84586
MGIGYLLLYGALAVVALWLVAELLFQNRAPLHWRGLALGGFLAVAGGMAVGSVPVIGAGAAMFAVGQTFVTLSVKRGYAAGWSLRLADGSLPGPLARVPFLGALTGGGAAVAAAAVAVEQVGEVGAVEEAPAAAPVAEETAVEQTAAFEMQELAADGVYAPAYYEQQPQPDPYAAYQQQPQQHQQYGYEQQQWQQPVGYDQGYGGYPQQQQPQYGYEQQPQPDPYAAYQQQPQQHQQYGYEQQQWQPTEPQPHPDQPITGIPQQPQQPHYDQYGYQQQHPTSWQQQP